MAMKSEQTAQTMMFSTNFGSIHKGETDGKRANTNYRFGSVIR